MLPAAAPPPGVLRTARAAPAPRRAGRSPVALRHRPLAAAVPQKVRRCPHHPAAPAAPPLAPGSPTPRRAAATTKFHVPPENPRRYEECFEALGQNIEDHVTIKRARTNLAPPRRRPSRPTAAPPPACLPALPHRLSAVCCPLQVDPAYRAHFGDGTSFDLVYDMLRFREQARVWRISAKTDWPARLQGRHALQSKPSRPLKPRKPCLRRLCPAARAKVRPLASAGGGAGAGSGGTLLRLARPSSEQPGSWRESIH